MAFQDTIGNGVWNIELAEVWEEASNFVHINVKSDGSSPALSGAYLKQTHTVPQEMWQVPTTQGPVATQLNFNNAKLSQSSSSSTQFAWK